MMKRRWLTKKIPAPIKTHNSGDPDNYFNQAASWADDSYATAIASRHRYQLAWIVSMMLAVLLAIAVSILIFTQQSQLVVVHEGDSGYAWVSTLKPNQTIPINFARTASEIAHYVRARESYDPLLYAYQTQEVKWQSSDAVYADYALSQASTNANAPITVLGAKGYRTVIIQSILPLDNPTEATMTTKNNSNNDDDNKGSAVNCVQVDFVTVDHVLGESKTIKTPYTALVSWRYAGVPTNPAKLYSDWDGFTVTKYQVEPVNAGNV
jgi:type IV secretory pathway component VirB8